VSPVLLVEGERFTVQGERYASILISAHEEDGGAGVGGAGVGGVGGGVGGTGLSETHQTSRYQFPPHVLLSLEGMRHGSVHIVGEWRLGSGRIGFAPPPPQ
jgi:hypothetical protein